MIEFSVIVPTFNRLRTLREALAALEAQVDAPAFEVIVVDDGSTDGTAEFLRLWTPSIPTQVIRQENSGPATARNAGIAVARGHWMAFMGDDTVPTREWLAAHHEAHRQRPDRVAVVGHTDWHPSIRVTPFFRFLNEQGVQFGYSLIEDAENLSYHYFYTSNVSLPREMAEPFSTAFSGAAWEDIELAYRLTRRGLRIVYEPRAQVAHDHPLTWGSVVERQKEVGRQALTFARLHPELAPELGLGFDGQPPRAMRAFAVRSLLARATAQFSIDQPRLWGRVLREYYLKGLREAVREAAAE